MTEEHAIYGLPSEDEATAAQWRRFFTAAGCKTRTDLAEFLRVSISSVSETIKSGPVPSGWLLEVLRLRNVNPEWILTGVSPQYLRPHCPQAGNDFPDPPNTRTEARVLHNILECVPAEHLLQALRRRNG